jgi:hypothetical protein
MGDNKKAGKEIVDKIAKFLETGPILDHFEFPRLHFPNIAGYKPEHYRRMGALIREGTLPVFIDEGAIPGATAFYQAQANRLNLTPDTAPLNTLEHWSTVVHEATHMIQDWKKWRITLSEMEADAHFAQALFMHYKGASFGGGLLLVFASAAKAFAAGDKKEFKKLIGEMYQRVNEKYQYKSGYENMFTKIKQDGIRPVVHG